jgi:hypothetical protein
MRYWFAFLMALAISAMGADVKPFVFGEVAGDSATQQAEFDYMLQYKLFGRDYMTIGNDVTILDKSGWNGTRGDLTVTHRLKLGGPTLVAGDIKLGDGNHFTTGPIRGNSLSIGNDNSSYFTGEVVLNNDPGDAVKGIISRSGGTYEATSATVPAAPSTLSIPTIEWPDTISGSNDIHISANNGVAYIDIPDGEGTYDLYLNEIHTGVGGTDGSKLYVRMQDGGRLTRIFVKDLKIGNHTTINVVYRTADGDEIQSQKSYRGNLMFYTDADITFERTDNVPIQGSFLTTGRLYLACNLDFAGQLLANQLEIGNTFNGENFRFVKFDPDTLDLDPTLNKDGGLAENDSTVIIPIQLSDTATVDVYFNYCFDLKDGVTVDDFNLVVDFPVCGEDSPKTVMIPTGSRVPSESIRVNVKKDTLDEPDDYLVLKISIESGAVLPNNRTDGELKVKIVDADVSRKLAFDTTAVYSEKENYTGRVDNIKVVNRSDGVKFYLDSAYTGRYSVDESTGEISILSPVDYETTPSDTVKVTVKDTGDVSITGYIPISVIDVNEKPAIGDTVLTFSENSPIPAIIGTVKATDPDVSAAFSDNVFSIADGGDMFAIDPATGRITASAILDYEKDPHEYVLKVAVTDRNDRNLADTATVTVRIADVDEAPAVAKGAFGIPENTIDTVGTLAAVDPEGKKVTYAIRNDVPFAIDSNGTMVNTRPFDYEKEKEFTVKVDVSDGKNVVPVEVKVTVSDVDEPVHARDTVFTVDEHVTGPIGKVNGEDEDGHPVKYMGTDPGQYSVDSLTGVVSLVKPYDYDSVKEDVIKVVVRDVNGNTDTATVKVRVNDVNEAPKLQPNDSLSVPENCKSCIVGIITAVDPDNDPVKYSVVEKGFTIDSNGVLKLTDPVDYEKTPVVKVTVVASDPTGASDTLAYTVKVVNINEPVHVMDTSCTVAENATGRTGCRVTAWDEDGTKPKYSVTDTSRFAIDGNGEIMVKEPFDFEEKDRDTVTVIVTDGEFSDTARVVVRVLDVPEKTEITEVDHQPKKDTVRTNTSDHSVGYRICEDGKCEIDSLDVKVRKDTVVKVCNAKGTSCDQVVFLFNDVPPVVILDNARNTSATIDYITIEEKNDGHVYVNRKDNQMTVTVKDTVRKTEKKFDISVKLDTVAIKPSHVREYNYLVDERKATVTPTGNGLAEVSEVIKVDGVKVTITKLVKMDTMDPVDTVQTVTYTTVENGREVTVTYTTDNLTGQRVSDYHVSYAVDSCTTVSYDLDGKKRVVKNKEGNIGYTVRYDYVDDFGNRASAKAEIVFDDIPPKVEILKPAKMTRFNTNAIEVKWTVNGEVQDTLNLQRLEKGVNYVIRRYVDKAGNVAVDTVTVIMEEAKDIDISIIHPVTEVKKDKVEEYYAEGKKYNPGKPYSVQFVNPDSGKLPGTIGVGFKVDIVLPSVSPVGGLATLDDLAKNGQIPVDDRGNIVGASTKGIPVDKYVEEHCTEEFKNEYRKNGLNIPLYDVTYHLHLWVFTTQANYVNDFKVEYTLNDQARVTDAGTVEMVIDWLADRDGNVKASNGKALGTGSYITKLASKSVARHRCDFKEQRKGEKTVKKEDDMTIFGYKRPTEK